MVVHGLIAEEVQRPHQQRSRIVQALHAGNQSSSSHFGGLLFDVIPGKCRRLWGY
jgi:hypothetical protein